MENYSIEGIRIGGSKEADVPYVSQEETIKPEPKRSSGLDLKFPSAPKAPPLKGEDCNLLTCNNNGWCLPLWIYLILSIIGLLGYIFSLHGLGATLIYLFVNILIILIFIFILYNLCYHKHIGWAWFVLFLPLILEITWIIMVSLYKF